ncbi:hypothetical protein OG21DRAFT_1508081 [Imleria badia]|nr:hypothetical protein OG21DRAFT_1508081 [Imleria badia]
MTALLLGKQNGATVIAEYDEEEFDEDEEYHDGEEGSAENPIDLSSVVAGSKRGVDELSEGDEYGCGVDEEDEDEGETVTKKARV